MSTLRNVTLGQGSSRRTFLRRAALAGLGAASAGSLLSACGSGKPGSQTSSGSPSGGAVGSRVLTVSFYDWILNLHPAIEQEINPEFSKEMPVEAKVAPVQGFGIDRFVAEAKDKTSSWDVYVGMTPFVEMTALVEAGVIEPWDEYIPKDVLADFIPAVREEGYYKGKLYGWPFLLDIIIQGWNKDLAGKAGLDPAQAPKTWDEFIAFSAKVKTSGVAPFGCVFDAHGWRSLAPITHSIDTNCYTEEGLFDFTHPAAVEALEIMRRMFELSPPNVLNPGTSDGGVNDTPDEGAFAAVRAAYYIKYQNAFLRFGNKWPDPSHLAMAALPKTEKGAGGTVFWDTGAALFRHGTNKKEAAKYLSVLTRDERIWRHSIAGGREAVGQVPVYQSIWSRWEKQRPEWMTDWAFLVREQLKHSKAIKNHKFGLTQFSLGQPHWEKYITGETKDPKAALAAAKDAVMTEVKKAG